MKTGCFRRSIIIQLALNPDVPFFLKHRCLSRLDFIVPKMSITPVAKSSDTEKHADDVEALLWHDGKVISGGDGGKVKVWTPDLKLITTFQAHSYPIYHMASAGKNFYTCSNDSKIHEWEPKADDAWSLARTLEGHQQPIRRLRVTDGVLYSGDESGEVRIWKDGKCKGRFQSIEEIWDMFVANNRIYLVRDRDVAISDLSSQGNVSSLAVLEGRGPLRVEGNKLVFVDRTGMDLVVHDNESKSFPHLGTLKGHSMIINTIIGDPDCFFSAGWDSKVIMWDLERLTKIAEQQLDGYANTMALDGAKTLYVGGASGVIQAFQINKLTKGE